MGRRIQTLLILGLVSVALSASRSSTHPSSPEILLANSSLRPDRDSSIHALRAGEREGILRHPDTGGRLPFLVQFDGPIRRVSRTELENTGAGIEGYIPHNTYLVRAAASQLDAIAAVEGVRWIGEYVPEYKLQKQLLDKLSVSHTASEPLLNNASPECPQDVVVTVMPSVETPGTVGFIRKNAGHVSDWKASGRKGVIMATLTTFQILQLTACPEVEWIEPRLTSRFDINAAVDSDRMNVAVMWNETGLTGTNQIIGHADTGIDLGCHTNMHPDIAGRIKAAFPLGRPYHFEHHESGPISGSAVNGGDERWVGVLFATGEENVGVNGSDLFLWCGASAECTGSLSAAVFSNAGGIPGTLLSDWSQAVSGDSVRPTGGWVSFAFANVLTLDANTEYWLVLDASEISGGDLFAARTDAAGYGANTWNAGGIWMPNSKRLFHRISGDDCPWDDPDGHGTHTAGSIVGHGASSTGKYRGVAYDAKLVHQSLIDSNGDLTGLPADVGDLFLQAYENGARVHSDSWSSGLTEASHGTYPTISRQVDEFMWDHPDMLIVFSSGNEAVDNTAPFGVVDSGSVKPPGTAKNGLTVGASENYHGGGGYTYGDVWPGSFPASPIRGDPMCDAQGGMAGFSGRGPCDDGRTKPDVVAPGTYVISCRSRHVDAAYSWGVADNSDYAYASGTSMSCPLVAGAAALVRQYYMDFRKMTNPAPSAALIKATMLNGALSLTPGQYGTGPSREIPDTPRPNQVEGWGQVNLGESLLPTNSRRMVHYDWDSLGVGECINYCIDVLATGKLSVTLAYTDYPAEVSSQAQLVNDLDLTLLDPAGVRHYPGSEGDQPDRVNNVETIDVPAECVGIGSYRIRITGHNVPQGPQPFAVVVSAGEVVPRSSIADLSRSASGNSLELSWKSRTGYHYTLQSRQDLGATWNDVPGHVDLAGTGTTLSYTNLTLNTPSGFYRVVIEVDI